METRANYIIVGIFTIVAVLAAFAFVYWTAGVGDRGETAQLRVRIPGSASGLGRGSAVLFNGVKVGDVQRVYIDVSNPEVAIADTRIDRLTPITGSTQVDVGLAGLTGQANIELRGGSPAEQNLLDLAEQKDTIAVVTANPSAVTNLLETAQSIFRRADAVLDEFEGFVTDVRGPLTESVESARAFAEALGNNAEGIDTFLASVSSLSETLAGVSGRLDTTLAAAEELIRSVDGERINAAVGNIEAFTEKLNSAGDGLDDVMANVDVAVQSVVTLTDSANQTMGRVDQVVASVDPQVVAEVMSNFQQASSTVSRVAEDVSRVAEVVTSRTDDIDRIIADARQLAERMNSASARVDSVMTRVDEIVSSGEAQGVISDARTTMQAYRELAGRLNSSSERLDSVLVGLKDLIGSGEAEGMMSQAGETLASYQVLAERLTQSSARLDEVLNNANNLLDDEALGNVVAEANETMRAFRRVADTLESRVGSVTSGLERFTNTGLRDVEALVRDSRRSISRIEQAITSIERNPQRILGGGEGTVREFDGRTRR
jgi:phospholipid/cholesterol/gamma-HCH transport system substrate-binding protein